MGEVVIVGGGLAGSAAAIRLARAGRAVTLVERSAGPHHKVCGEFLSGEALGELSALGIDPGALAAPALSRVRIAARRAAQEAALPFPAYSLTRWALDEALLAKAAGAGVRVERGVVVSRAGREADGWAVRLSDGRRLASRTLLAATGKHDLRGHARPDGLHGDLVGLKAYYRLSAAAARDLRGSVDVAFFPGGYCGFQLVETGQANACLVVSRARLAALGGDPWAVFAHVASCSAHARSLLEGAERTLEKPLAIGRVPYGYVRTGTDGAFHVGDQAAVIPSFCGEGMGLALRSGRMAAEAILAGQSAAAFQRRFARLAYARVKGTALLSRVLSGRAAQQGAVAVAGLAPRVVTALAAATRTPQPRGGRASGPMPSSS